LESEADKNSIKACVTSLSPANNFWKLSPLLEKHLNQVQKQKAFSFTIVANRLEVLLQSLNGKQIPYQVINKFPATNAAVIRCNAADFSSVILNENELVFADEFISAKPDEMVIGYDRSINQLNHADYYFPNADGHGITIGIKENKINETDIDLQQRIQPSILASAVGDNHATTVSSLAGGAGNSFYTGKGVAHKCNFLPSSFSNLFPDSSALLLQKNVSVQNHSYGTVIQSFYGAEAMSYDVQTAQNKNLVHLFSSGNSGTAAATTGSYANLNGFANLTGNFKMAKNVVTVAAVDTGINLTPFSSSGPLYDGRIAPQVAALGPNGTSEAAAIVSGTVAVLQQVYKDSNAQAIPPASLMKAVLYNSCDDIGRKGIDYHSGYGLVNEYAAIRCLQQKHYDGGSLQQAQTWTKNITLPAQSANLKITLCWTDTAAQVNNSKALVNDLDIELTELTSGAVYRPWVLSSAANIDSLIKLPVRRKDSLNTSEQISIELPVAGVYQINVIGSKVSTAQVQPFHIAFGWDTLNKLQFTNPVAAGDIDPDEYPVQTVRWSVALADTNAIGTISVTYNGGQSWQTIANNIALKNKRFRWVLPDTTAIAQLRMQTPFGTFVSERFVLAKVSKLKVDFLCTDSFRVSWQRNRLASQYQLFSLRSDTAFIKPTLVTNDTFVVLRRSLHAENIYAVQPILSGGPQAARSIAVNILNQGVNCYYNTLLASLVGDDVLLSLELNYTVGVDSIRFEKVNGSGIPLYTIATQNAISGQKIYTTVAAMPASGINYYRAAIWIGGRVVYTEIVSVQATGNQQIIVYPNPVLRGRDINFIMRDAAGQGVLQISDMAGRIIRKQTVILAGTIATHGLPAGVYLYQLFAEDNSRLATGKILVQ
jgi:hypothetical protein